MPRYANFNTGFEYKFYLGIQPSDSIYQFGGDIIQLKTLSYNSENFEQIRNRVLDLLQVVPFNLSVLKIKNILKTCSNYEKYPLDDLIPDEETSEWPFELNSCFTFADYSDVIWNDSSYPFLNSKIAELSSLIHLDEPEYDSFEKKLEGTQLLSDYLRELIYDKLSDTFDSENDLLLYDFRLGCLIKHQLSYKPVLTSRVDLV